MAKSSKKAAKTSTKSKAAKAAGKQATRKKTAAKTATKKKAKKATKKKAKKAAKKGVLRVLHSEQGADRTVRLKVSHERNAEGARSSLTELQLGCRQVRRTFLMIFRNSFYLAGFGHADRAEFPFSNFRYR